MKKTALKFMVPVAFGLGMVAPALADNPIIQTYYSPDPAPVVFGDTLCVYTGNDEGGSFFTMHGWRVSCTTDMVNWTDMNTLILEADDFNGSAKKNGDWASQCIRRNDKYYYYVTVEASNGGGRAVNVAVSDTKEGPFKDALDGKYLAGPNWNYIDPTVFIDDDGQAYLYWGNPKLYWAKLNEDMISLVDGVHETNMDVGFDGKYTEGPWIHKRGSKYYMIYAASGVPESIDYSWSDSPTGPWEYKGTIMPSGESGAAFTVHSGIIDFKGHSYFFYHNQRTVPGAGGYSRTSAVEEFTWNDDGTLPTIHMTDDGVTTPVQNLDPYTRVEAETKAWLEGINLDKTGGYTIIDNIETEGKTVYLTNMGADSYTKVRSVDMSDGADNIVVCTKGAAGKIELHLGSATGTLISTINVPASDAWQESSFAVTGAEGVNDLYFVFKEGNFKFDYWYFETSAQATPQTPYNGKVAQIPGKIEAENYDENGVGSKNHSFYDMDSENQGGYYRTDAVDIVRMESDEGKTLGYAIGYTQAGEWLEYTVNVAADAEYTITANIATAFETSGMQLFMDDDSITGTFVAPKVDTTWNVYKEVELGKVNLTKGEHVLKLVITGAYLNVDWIRFTNPDIPETDSSSVIRNVKLVTEAESTYSVFSVTGKFMGRINGKGSDVADMLNRSGFAKGIYMVRGSHGGRIQKVNTLQ